MRRLIRDIPRRFRAATGYSLAGFKAAALKEDAFKLEMMALLLLVLTLIPVPWPLWKKTALAAVYLLIPLMELLNSALEDLCDLVCREKHPLVKAAKDKGSAAVLLAIFINIIWLITLIMI